MSRREDVDVDVDVDVDMDMDVDVDGCSGGNPTIGAGR